MRSFRGVAIALVLGAVLAVAAVFGAAAALDQDAAAEAATPAAVDYGQR
jgi:hypothetical protein